MQKWTIPAIVLAIVLFLAMLLGGAYNGLVTSRENVNKVWADVETQYQRRTDLIPNLVSTVKGASNFEQSTLTQVVEARAQATQIKVDANDPASVERFQQAQSNVSSSLSRLLAVVENYPDLKATAQYQSLSDELAGTENRIAVARRDFNEAARAYNVKVQTFPTNVIAGMFGFNARPLFAAEAGADKAPTVDFGASNAAANTAQ